MTLVPLLLPLLYLLIHSLLVFLSTSPRIFRKSRILLVNLGLAAGFGALLGWLSQVERPEGMVLAWWLWCPVVFFWWAYLWTRPTLDALHPPEFTIDASLIRLDEKIGQPSLHWARRGNRLISEVLHFFYSSYYLYTPVLGLVLHISGRNTEFQEMSLAVCLSYLVSYVLFAVLPAHGPRWALVDAGLLRPEEQRSEGYIFVRFINLLMYGGPALKGGAMPSGHTAIAVIFAWWCGRIWGWPGGFTGSIIALGMMLGAIYGRYHFISDVLAGAVLGALCILSAGLLIG